MADGTEVHVNRVYDIFAATEEEFALIFPPGEDVASTEFTACCSTGDSDVFKASLLGSL